VRAGMRGLSSKAAMPHRAFLAAGAVGAGTIIGFRSHCSAATSTVRFGMCQIMVSDDKQVNIGTARKALKDSATQGSQIVCLPEIWNGPYAAASFPLYAEPIPEVGGSIVDPKASPSTWMLSEAAKAHKIFVIGGSISERAADGSIFNTSCVFSPEGALIAKHRKIHLFDIDIPGKITFKESDTLTGGTEVTTFETPWGKVGLGICYDIRFAELALLMRHQGCKLLVYPGAFNLTTGPAHWELLQRARAVDNQVYVAAVSPARNPDAAYQAWGHSTVVGPWADIVASVSEQPVVIYADLDMDRVEEVRSQVPISHQRRKDLYQVSAPKETTRLHSPNASECSL